MINNSYESSSSSSESSSLSNSPVPLANFTNYWQAYNLDSTQNKIDSFNNYPYYNFPLTAQQNNLQSVNKYIDSPSPPLDVNSYKYNNMTVAKSMNNYFYQNENQPIQQPPFIFNYNSYLDASYPTPNVTSSQNLSDKIVSINSSTITTPPNSNTHNSQAIIEKPNNPMTTAPVKTGSVVNRRRNRTQFSNSQIESLEAVFEKTHYPEVQLVDRLSEKLNLSIERISIWFQNRRAKDKKSKKNGHKKSSEVIQSCPNIRIPAGSHELNYQMQNSSTWH